MDEIESRRQDVMQAAGLPQGIASTWTQTLRLVEGVAACAETATEWCDRSHQYRMERDRAVAALEAHHGSNEAVASLYRELSSLRELHRVLLQSYNDQDKKLIEVENLLALAMREGLKAVTEARANGGREVWQP